MPDKPRILVFAGSAREASLNKKLARAAAKVVNEQGGEATYIDLRDYPMPIYEGDLEEREGMPEAARRLRELFDALRSQGLALDTLSMGMSEDFETAIAFGATSVRVGSALFGARG